MARTLVSLCLFLLLLVSCALAQWADHFDDIDDLDKPHVDIRDLDHQAYADYLTLLGKRDEYSCSKKKPCGNGACCGKSGYCGYGKKYCGTTGESPNDDCWSNCDAHAECGKDAKKPGTKCPLNVCCSEFGFCGTTEEFCGDGCQSGCEDPSSGGSNGNVQERVIGYYEAWNHEKKCMGMPIHKIPVESLTHVNYAFAYISPDDFEIGPMPDVDESTIKEFTKLKERNSKVILGVSLGGWTFNDNKTDTQIVFHDLSSSEEKRSKFIKNLVSFMNHYGFDAADLDWEYPGAPDRQPPDTDTDDDGKNYVKLMQEITKAFKDEGKNWELSFTAPTSYWYLRWFDIKEMVKAVTYVNMMSYDLHGVWDGNNPIGKQVLGHTNLTEIDQALDLLWRNDVAPEKVNLGLAFYARTFELKDKKCTKPGCKFEHGGKKGACTDASGILAYNEIVDIIHEQDIEPVYDQKNAIKYMVWDEKQWLSYDDQQTFQQKIKFANERGLGGLLIWAIDQDTKNYDALRGVLYPKEVLITDGMKDDTSYWEDQHPGDCISTACGKGCSTGWVKMDTFDCPDGDGDSTICCPISSAPNPDDCAWRGNPPLCNGQCHGGEVALASATHGGNGGCDDGRQFYCCKIPDVAAGDGINCGWKQGECSDDQEVLTFAGTFLTTIENMVDWAGLQGAALADFLRDIEMDNMQQYCCSKEEIKNWKDCYWAGTQKFGYHSCDDNHCETGIEVMLTNSPYGEGGTCSPNEARQRAFCCTPASGETPFLPVPLDYLFPDAPDDLDPDFNLQVDDTWGTGDSEADEEPDEASFGFVVVTAPDEVNVSIDKRDGSSWEVMDCPDSDEEREHTVRMVCTDPSEDSSCNHIYRGYGVPGTILQMPDKCGPGRYAVAKTFGISENQSLPGHLNKRDLGEAKVYDLTFDYNFARVPRDFGDSQVRVDFSNQPGYWDKVVDRPGYDDEGERHSARAKRDETGYKKNRKRWMEEEWRDAYHMGGMKRDEIHKRWFGENILKWLAELIFVGEAEVTEELNHRVEQELEVILIDQQFGPCPVAGGQAQANIKSTITADLKVETSFGMTLIATLSKTGMDLSQSYLYFKNRGSVKAKFELDAVASWTYETGDKKLIGLDDFPGATFRVPGIVTVGPNIAVYASANAELVVAGHFEAAVTVAEWEIEQTYPQTEEYPAEVEDGPDRDGTQMLSDPKIDASVTANGEISVHIKPTVTFGIVFDDRWGVDRCSVDLVLDGYVIAWAEAKYELNGNNDCPFKYGIDAGSTLYAQLNAPKLFDWGGTKRVVLSNVPRKQLTPDSCPKSDDNKRWWIDGVDSEGDYLSPVVGRDAVGALAMHEKRDKYTVGPLVTIPDSFLNCPNDAPKSNGSECIICSMYGVDKGPIDDPDDQKAVLTIRADEGDSCPYYPPVDTDDVCNSDSDSRLEARAPKPSVKHMELSWIKGKKDTYLKYPSCQAKFGGPSGVVKYYLPTFMLADPNPAHIDVKRCMVDTIQKDVEKDSTDGKYYIEDTESNPNLAASLFRSEHVFEVHLVEHFLEWVCQGDKELGYGDVGKLPWIGMGWTQPDTKWCTDVFGRANGQDGVTWPNPNDKNNKKNWIGQTSSHLGSVGRLDLLTLYHDKPNGVKKTLTEGKQSRIEAGMGFTEAKERVMIVATVFDYLRKFEYMWTYPSNAIEKVSAQFDKEYADRIKNGFKPGGTALKPPAKPADVDSWGLRTLWCYWIDNHLARVEGIMDGWHSTSKSLIEQKHPQVVTKMWVRHLMDNGGSASTSKLRFPTKNAAAPLPGSGSAASEKSRYGMWGDNKLGKLGL